LPVRVPELTVRITGVQVEGVVVDGAPLVRSSRRRLQPGAWAARAQTVLAAFNPVRPVTRIDLL